MASRTMCRTTARVATTPDMAPAKNTSASTRMSLKVFISKSSGVQKPLGRNLRHAVTHTPHAGRRKSIIRDETKEHERDASQGNAREKGIQLVGERKGFGR